MSSARCDITTRLGCLELTPAFRAMARSLREQAAITRREPVVELCDANGRLIPGQVVLPGEKTATIPPEGTCPIGSVPAGYLHSHIRYGAMTNDASVGDLTHMAISSTMGKWPGGIVGVVHPDYGDVKLYILKSPPPSSAIPDLVSMNQRARNLSHWSEPSVSSRFSEVRAPI